MRRNTSVYIFSLSSRSIISHFCPFPDSSDWPHDKKRRGTETQNDNQQQQCGRKLPAVFPLVGNQELKHHPVKRQAQDTSGDTAQHRIDHILYPVDFRPNGCDRLELGTNENHQNRNDWHACRGKDFLFDHDSKNIRKTSAVYLMNYPAAAPPCCIIEWRIVCAPQ